LSNENTNIKVVAIMKKLENITKKNINISAIMEVGIVLI
jgi:hypothetical protein